jgi:gamma-glutamyl phosphate reductase
MQALSAEKRSKIISEYAKLLLENSRKIEEANNVDIDLAKKNSNISNYLLFEA